MKPLLALFLLVFATTARRVQAQPTAGEILPRLFETITRILCTIPWYLNCEDDEAPPTSPTPVPVTPPPTPPATQTSTPPLSLDGRWEIFDNQDIAGRHEACFVMVGSKAYLLGGRESQDVDIFDPETFTWSKGQTAPELLHHMQCAEVDGKIYLPAAWTKYYPNEDTVDVMYIYDTVSDNWYFEEAMPEHRRRGAAAIVVDGTKIWVSHGNIGGHEQNEDFAQSYGWIDYYDTATQTWVMGDDAGFPDAPNPRNHTGGGLVNGRICVAGGRDGGIKDWPAVSPTDCFDPGMSMKLIIQNR